MLTEFQILKNFHNAILRDAIIRNMIQLMFLLGI